MPASEHDQASVNPVRPGDFAQVLLAASGSPPRARARDQQADVAGESLRRSVLNRLIILDPEPEDLGAALLMIVQELGEPEGPTRGVCTAILQEWEMARIQPDYWAFLVRQAIQPERRTRGSRSHQAAEPGAEV